MLKRLAARAKVKKRVYPYIFRHGQAMSDCQEISEPVMRKLYGWSKTSKTPSHYEHLFGRDAKLARLKQAGEILQEDKKPIRLCPRCKKPNSAAATMCHAYGSILSIKTATEIQEDRDKLRKEAEEQREQLSMLTSQVGQLTSRLRMMRTPTPEKEVREAEEKAQTTGKRRARR
jgi:hypothetical protein